MLHHTSRRGNGLGQSLRHGLRRAVEIEWLEQRRLLTILNPQLVGIGGLPIEGQPFGASSPRIALFASPAPIANLSALVIFPSGTVTATVISTGNTETIDGVNVPEFQINYTGNWTPPDESPAVPFSVTITDSTPGTGNTTELGGAVAVRDAPLTPVSTLATAGAVEGQATEFDLVTFVDGNSIATAADFTANIDWGDGTQSVGTVTQDGSNFKVIGTHTFQQSSTIHVQVLDKGGSSLSTTSSASLIDAPLSNGAGTSFTGTEGQTLNNVLLGTFTDGNPSAEASDFSAQIDWGDGTANAGTASVIGGDANGALIGIYGNHTYATDSITPFVVTVNVSDVDGSTLPAIQSSATISDPLLIMAGGYKLKVVEGKSTGTQTVATFIDPGGNEPPAAYTATVDWGDGTDSAGTISFANGFFSVSGPHTYAHAKSTPYVITTTIEHVPGIPQSVTSSATITPAPLAGSAVTTHGAEGRSKTVDVANFTAATATSASSFTASINWGDGHSSAGTIVKDASGKYHVNGSHAYAEENTSGFPVKVTIKQSGGATVVVNSKAEIADSPLDQAAGRSLTASKNVSFSNRTLGNFRDQDALNTSAGDYAGIIDWGDGTKSAAVFLFISATSNVGSFWKVLGSHKYTTAKTFTVKITLHDTGSPSKTITITSTIKVT